MQMETILAPPRAAARSGSCHSGLESVRGSVTAVTMTVSALAISSRPYPGCRTAPPSVRTPSAGPQPRTS
ncbi:hypothetical protein AXK56_21575 [Tsukamurella pulmonis]|nr:hypothetical protein AXK56_21575 [Tsukamurella pulmonis]